MYFFPEIHVLEVNYVDNSNYSWIIDSGATDHVCSSFQVLRKTKALRDGELTLRLENGTSVAAVVVGEVHLVFDNKFLILNNVYYVPNFCRNIISFFAFI